MNETPTHASYSKRHSKRQLKTLVFAWFAVTALLLSAACTKSDNKQSLPAPGAVPPPAQTNVGGQPRQGAKPKPVNSKRTGRSELDGDSSKSAQEDQGTEEIPADAATPASESPGTTAGPSEGEVITDPTGLKPDDIFAASDKLGQPAPGPQAEVNSADPLYYSGAGQDLLREQLQALIATEAATAAGTDADSAKNDRDQKFAMRVGLSTFIVNADTRQAWATVTLLGNKGEKKQYEFKGTLDNQSRLRGGDLKKTGLAFEAVCMDESGGCNTVQMRIRKASSGGIATAHVIARHSTAYIYSEGTEPSDSTNPEYIRLMNIFVNTANKPYRADSVRALSFWTSEAINGRSDFAVQMRVGADAYHPQNEQMFSITGPLVKPASSGDLNLVISRPSGLATIGGKTVVMRGQIMDSIREMRLVRNDGRGNLQFDITVRKGSARAEEESIRLTVARIHEAVKSPIVR